MHRSVAYRLLRTLEDHGLVARDAAGRIALGARMAALAAGVAHDLQAEALPELTAVANDLGMTCFLAVLDHDECITLASVEPRHAVASVAQRPGPRHPITVGAPSKAILSAMTPSNGRRCRRPTARRDDGCRGARVGDEPRRGHPERAGRVGSAGRARPTPAAIAVVYVASAHDPPRSPRGCSGRRP